VHKGLGLLGAFTALVKTNYGAGLNEVDFRNATESARQTINRWVEDHTAGKITNLIPLGALATDTKLVLTNAVYFKDRWLTTFDKKLTRDEDFHLANGRKTRVPMMQLSGEFNYAQEKGFQVLELPYQDKHLSMIVFLPDGTNGLSAFEKSISVGHIKGWLGNLRNTPDVHVYLPRFKLTEQISLGDTLEAMGMRRAFDRHKADFSGVTDKYPLFISAVIHKAYVAVDEQGTEAAAATGVVMVPTMAVIRRPPVIFRADHPFVFLIRDNRSGSTLFMGRLSDRSSQETRPD